MQSKAAAIWSLRDDRSSALPKEQRKGNGVTKTKDRIREIAFIDPAVSDIEKLIAGVRPEVLLVRLDATTAAPAQIARALAGRTGFTDIHVITHGAPGELCFTAGRVELRDVQPFAAELRVIGEALGRNGRLVLWSCETAQGRRGAEFISALARATGAEIAASSKWIGAATQGGSWALNSRSFPSGFAQIVGATAAVSAPLPPLTPLGWSRIREYLQQ